MQPPHHSQSKRTLPWQRSKQCPAEATKLKPLNTAALEVLAEDDFDDAITYINELLKTSDKLSTNQTYWFLTPEVAGDPTTHTPIRSRFLKVIKELEGNQKLNPNMSPSERGTFLKNIKWDDSQLTEKGQKDIEEILIEFHDIFAGHRLDKGDQS